ncbi:universal stress protein [Salidesulfovibrio onnuriiensis]|uniref:universal stress protein n=1 Tax=Salidesulfovibrio onnuriiensis TaxID=2583823 RepID=UPI00202B127D|nr:universal stress protein [Salidesulfovibrio onnuriiensis]
MMALIKRLVGTRGATAESVQQSNETQAVRSERTRCKILVVCKGYAFSDGVMDYAIDMAAKTRSDLVALNLDTTGRDFDGFQARAKENIDRFSDRATTAGLLFSHEVRHGDEETVIGTMHQEDARFRYVMDDTVVTCKNRKVIPVYTRATLRAK